MIGKMIAAALISGIVFTSSIAQEVATVKPIKWDSVYGLNFPGVKGYVDTNHRKTQVIDKEVYGSGEILFSYATPVVIKVGEEIVLVRGIVRSMVVECKTGSSMPLFDLFYSESLPERKDKPVDAADYRDREDLGTTLSPRSPVYAALCPKFV